MSEIADQDPKISELVSIPDWADEQGFNYAGARHFALKWPDATVRIGPHLFVIRDRIAARLAEVDLRPHARKPLKPRSPRAVRESGNEDQ